MKKNLYYLSLAAVLSLCACSGKESSGDGRKHSGVPDSLKNERLIAAFYDEEAGCSVFLRYDNSSTSTGKKITMCDNDQGSYQEIKSLGDNKFICEQNNTEYEVLENKVISTVGGVITRNVSVANLPDILEHKRIDK